MAASIFLAHAELENFFADLLSAFANATSARVQKGSGLPPMLQSHLFVEKANLKSIIANSIAGRSEEDMLKGISRSLKNVAGSLVNDAVPLAAFTGKDIYCLQKYPSQDNLRKVFFRIGIANIFDRASAIMKQDSSATLESLSSLRTQLAHTATLPGISPKDIRDRLRGTERFVAAIDRVVFKEVSAQFGSTIWQAHMS